MATLSNTPSAILQSHPLLHSRAAVNGKKVALLAIAVVIIAILTHHIIGRDTISTGMWDIAQSSTPGCVMAIEKWKALNTTAYWQVHYPLVTQVVRDSMVNVETWKCLVPLVDFQNRSNQYVPIISDYSIMITGFVGLAFLGLILAYYTFMLIIDLAWFVALEQLFHLFFWGYSILPWWLLIAAVALLRTKLSREHILAAIVLVLTFSLPGIRAAAQNNNFDQIAEASGPFAVVFSSLLFVLIHLFSLISMQLDFSLLLLKAYGLTLYTPITCAIIYIIISLSLQLYFPRVYDVKGFRRRIRETKRPTNTNYNPGKQHTHPNSARQRASANDYLKRLISPTHSMYSVGRGSDPLPGVDKMFGVKSEVVTTWLPAIFEPAVSTITFLQTLFSNHWLIFKNSDYYVDPTYYMAWGKNISIVTHDFSIPGGSSDEFTWGYVDNQVSMTVRGGARYKHSVNRYDTDVVCTRNIISPLLTTIIRVILGFFRVDLLFTYDVHYFTQNDYTYITMTPRHTINTYSTPHLVAEPENIKTFQNSYQGTRTKINAQVIQTKSSTSKEMRVLYISFPGSDLSFSVQWSGFLHCAALLQLDPTTKANNNKHLLHNIYEENHAEVFKEAMMDLYPYVDHLLENMYINMSYNELEQRLIRFHIDDVDGLPPDLDAAPYVKSHFKQQQTKEERKKNNDSYKLWVTKRIDNFSSYHRSPGELHNNYKPAMQMIFPLLVKAPICTPCRSDFADRDAYLGRLLSVNRDDEELRKKNIDWDLIEQIIRFIFDTELEPLSFQEAEHHYNTHSNLKTRFEEFANIDKTIDATDMADDGINNFVKTELQTKDPSLTSYRNITNDTDILVIAMTRYTKAMSRHLAQHFPGYAFGQSAASLAKHIHDLSNQYDTVVETDYSAFDGTQNTLSWLIECMAYKIAFGDQADAIIKCKYKSYCATVKAFGYRYSTLGTRHSGAADTSLMNTLVNLIVTTYVRCKYMKDNQIFYTVAQEFSKNIAGGDDGLAFDMSPELAAYYETATKELGLEIKAQTKKTSQPINMLARIYPNPRADPGSGVDIKRMLLKLTHSGLKHDRLSALALKVSGYITTDYATPLVAEWLTELVRVLDPMVDSHIVGRMLTANEISYTARLGQPLPVTLAMEYLAANDSEAVVAMQHSLRELKQISVITQWDPTVFKTQDVGDYNNDDYDSKKPNRATAKLNSINAYGQAYNDLSDNDKRSLPNETITDAYKNVFSQYKDLVLNDVTPCPEVISEFYKTLNRPYLLQHQPSDNQLLIYYPSHSIDGYYNKCFDFLKTNHSPCILTTTVTFVDKYSKVIAAIGYQVKTLGNNVALVYGKRSPPRKPRSIGTADISAVPPPKQTAPTKTSYKEVNHPALDSVKATIDKVAKVKQPITNKAAPAPKPVKPKIAVPSQSATAVIQHLQIDLNPSDILQVGVTTDDITQPKTPPPLSTLLPVALQSNLGTVQIANATGKLLPQIDASTAPSATTNPVPTAPADQAVLDTPATKAQETQSMTVSIQPQKLAPPGSNSKPPVSVMSNYMKNVKQKRASKTPQAVKPFKPAQINDNQSNKTVSQTTKCESSQGKTKVQSSTKGTLQGKPGTKNSKVLRSNKQVKQNDGKPLGGESQ